MQNNVIELVAKTWKQCKFVMYSKNLTGIRDIGQDLLIKKMNVQDVYIIGFDLISDTLSKKFSPINWCELVHF